jgi:hypothetical protein
MKKLIILGIAVLTFLAGVFAWFITAQPDVFLKTVSPNGIYTVELIGDPSRPSFPLIDHKTNFNLFKHGQPLVQDAHVMRYDILDKSFGFLYPEHQWIYDGTLRFSSDISKSEKSSDMLFVYNKTDKRIKFLRIVAGDMLLIFEMWPGNLRLSVPHLGDLPWVMAEGEFDDGQQIKRNGVNFLNIGKSEDSLCYCVSVTENGLKIESPVLSGYDSEASHDKPNISVVAGCDFF